MRDILNLLENILTEASLTPKELAKHDGKYLETLIQFAGNKLPVAIDPAYRGKYGDNAQVDPTMVGQLNMALSSGDILKNLPKNVTLLVNGEKVVAPWGAIFKGKEFTGAQGKKSYNAGHLAELFMGLAVSAKFFNLGADINTKQLIDMMGFLNAEIPQGQKNYALSLEKEIKYPEASAKEDTLLFRAVVPARSAEAFIEQLQAGQFAQDLQAVFASAVLYANESVGIANACQRVRQDKNNNRIDVISDGTSDAKGTKADLVLKVDGTKINLLSLKTFSSDTLGQISGINYDAVSKWFKVSFGLDLSKYESLFDPTLSKETVYKNILKIYDDVIYPTVKSKLEDQSPGKEAQIVKQLASAANYFARGESLEDVEIVKLDDKVTKGNYKILKFSDDLNEAMKYLDLEVKLVGEGQGRTIQIWVKPTEGEKVAKGSNKLCQFRTQKMGDSYRNYFESGPMLEKLTALEPTDPEQKLDAVTQKRSGVTARAGGVDQTKKLGSEKTLGRKRQR
jgi:hypothetical protein